MAEIYLVRHAKSYANVRDFTAFDNEESPLMEKGIQQAEALNQTFKDEYGIIPEEYVRPVLASMFVRPQQTAAVAGFRDVHSSALINESAIDRVGMTGTDVIRKHATERWVPDETKERASRFLDLVRRGDLDYEIFFSHGVFIASAKMIIAEEYEAKGQEPPFEFRDKSGYIPDLGTAQLLIV